MIIPIGSYVTTIDRVSTMTNNPFGILKAYSPWTMIGYLNELLDNSKKFEALLIEGKRLFIREFVHAIKGVVLLLWMVHLSKQP